MSERARSGALPGGAGVAPANAFPLLAALAFLVVALLTFFSSTVPALAEKDRLRATRSEMQKLKDTLDATLEGWRGREAAMDLDVETLLVEIDRLGLLPSELVPRTEEPATEPAAEPAAARKRAKAG